MPKHVKDTTKVPKPPKLISIALLKVINQEVIIEERGIVNQ